AAVRGGGADVVVDAEAAGIAWTAADAGGDRLAARIRAGVSARRDDVRAVREQATRLAQAERDHARAAAEVAAADAAVADAEQAGQRAEAAVGEARRQAHAGVEP